MLSDDSSIYGYIVFFLMIRRPPRSTRTDTLFPYTTLFAIALSLRGREKGASTPSVTPGHRRNMIRSARAFYVVSLLSMFILWFPQLYSAAHISPAALAGLVFSLRISNSATMLIAPVNLLYAPQ